MGFYNQKDTKLTDYFIFVVKYSEKQKLKQTPEIEILIATMNRENLDFLDSMFPFPLPDNVNLLIVNQSSKTSIENSSPKIRLIHSEENGLSKSRNLALTHALGKICVFTDDDVVFLEDFDDKIKRAFAEFPESSLIRFQYESQSGLPAKKYPSQPQAHLSKMDLLNLSSVEMVINQKKINKKGIRFNEHFGLGSSVFEMGEEQVFAAEIRKTGGQLSYFPESLLLHPQESSAEKITDDKRYYIYGGVIKAVFGKNVLFWVLLKLFFELKNTKIRFSQLKNLLSSAFKGKNDFIKLNNE